MICEIPEQKMVHELIPAVYRWVWTKCGSVLIMNRTIEVPSEDSSEQLTFSEVSVSPGIIEIDSCALKRLTRKEVIQFFLSHKTSALKGKYVCFRRTPVSRVCHSSSPLCGLHECVLNTLGKSFVCILSLTTSE